MESNAERQRRWRDKRNRQASQSEQLKIDLDEARVKLEGYKAIIDLLREADEDTYYQLRKEADR